MKSFTDFKLASYIGLNDFFAGVWWCGRNYAKYVNISLLNFYEVLNDGIHTFITYKNIIVPNGDN